MADDGSKRDAANLGSSKVAYGVGIMFPMLPMPPMKPGCMPNACGPGNDGYPAAGRPMAGMPVFQLLLSKDSGAVCAFETPDEDADDTDDDSCDPPLGNEDCVVICDDICEGIALVDECTPELPCCDIAEC